MASLTVRNLDDGLKRLLRIRAAENGRSMEEEVREILRKALTMPASAPDDLATAIWARFEPRGGIDLDLPPREAMRDAPDLN